MKHDGCRNTLNLSDCALNEKGKEEFLAKIDNFHDVLVLCCSNVV